MPYTPFPVDLESVLKKIAREKSFCFRGETHYDSNDRELYWFKNNVQYRISFTFVDERIKVVFYKDFFKANPKLCLWLHNNIPMFPRLAKIEWKELGGLLINQSADFYYQKILSFISNISGG